MKSKKTWMREWGGVSVLILASLIALASQTTTAQDLIKGWDYRPTSAMEVMMGKLELTPTARRILNATRPSAETDTEDFAAHCYRHAAENVSILGCYVDGQIYVYEITRAELVDENSVTLAHELLHAAWERLSSRTQEKLKLLLEQVYNDNRAWFDAQLSSYPESAKTEEIYTRAGTRLTNLPSELEEHYASYFTKRQIIAEYHKKYEAPFQELTAEIDALRVQIEAARVANDAERAAYRTQLQNLNARIEQFNACANTAGCFKSQDEFERERRKLDAEQTALENARQSLNQKIDENNARIEKYESLRASLGELNSAVDSRVEIESKE